MDITDVEGDRAGGVRTLPVLMGRDSALAFAAALLTVGVATAVVGVAEGEQFFCAVEALLSPLVCDGRGYFRPSHCYLYVSPCLSGLRTSVCYDMCCGISAFFDRLFSGI